VTVTLWEVEINEWVALITYFVGRSVMNIYAGVRRIRGLLSVDVSRGSSGGRCAIFEVKPLPRGVSWK
jgi:hypothetical protein